MQYTITDHETAIVSIMDIDEAVEYMLDAIQYNKDYTVKTSGHHWSLTKHNGSQYTFRETALDTVTVYEGSHYFIGMKNIPLLSAIKMLHDEIISGMYMDSPKKRTLAIETKTKRHIISFDPT